MTQNVLDVEPPQSKVRICTLCTLPKLKGENLHARAKWGRTTFGNFPKTSGICLTRDLLYSIPPELCDEIAAFALSRR